LFVSDFDGIPTVTKGLEDVSKYVDLITEMIVRGYSDNCVRNIVSRNFIRVLQAAEEFARKQPKAPIKAD